VIEELGGFDESSFSTPGGEDTDLAWRAIRAGADTVFAPDALVHHAVIHAGPLGMLRYASHWHETMLVFKRYPEIRKRLHRGLFWKWTHYALLRALIALVLPRRFRMLRRWLVTPYVRYLLTDRSRRAGPLYAPYVLALDLAELIAVVRGAIRYRTLVL